jgi:hypothetical protein
MKPWKGTNVDFRLTLSINLEIPNTSITDVFNNIRLSPEIPFCKHNEYYKIRTDYRPEELPDMPDQGVIYLLLRSAVVQILGNDDGTYSVLIDSVNKKETDANMEIIISALNDPTITISKSRDVKTSGIYYYFGKRFNAQVFADMVMNDLEIAQYINVDESAKASKRADDDGATWLYFHLNSEQLGHVTGSVSEKLVDKLDPILRTSYRAQLKLNQPYVRVNVTDIGSQEKMHAFVEFFSGIMETYETKYPTVCASYTMYKTLSKFGVIDTPEEIELKYDISKLVPEVFITDYKRICGKYFGLRVFDEPPNEPHLVFPRPPGDYSKSYASDGRNVKYYTSVDEKFPFVGVMKNTLPNQDEYPFIPCCFKEDQSGKNNYKEYYLDEVKIRGANKIVIANQKKLSVGQMGLLPQSISPIFNTVNQDIVRIGVTSNASDSLLACVNNALGAKVPLSRLIEHINASAQSTYGLSSPVDLLKTYIDPRLFVGLLECVFNTRILCFNANGFILPRFTEGYYTYKRTGRVVCVYENDGTCELIGTNRVRTHRLSRNLRAFTHRYEYYALTKKIEPIDQIPFEVESQFIDSNGKCRRLNVRFNNELLSIPTVPLPPLPVKMDMRVYASQARAIEFLTKHDSLSILCKETEEVRAERDQLTIFSLYKKYARYLTEYSLWAFSKFIAERGLKLTDSTLLQFVKEKTVVDERIDYEIPKKQFTEDVSFMRGGKILYSSEECRRRMVYVIKLYSIRNTRMLMEYKDRVYIQTLYTDISDFTIYPDQIVLHGEDSMERWISNQNTYKLKRGYTPGMEPYFVKFAGVVTLCQNAESLAQASDILKTWITQGYNKIYSSETVDNGLNARVLDYDTAVHIDRPTIFKSPSSDFVAMLSLE